jgi:hypothetical protein
METRIRRPALEGGVRVDLNRIIQDLKAERDRLAAAIECLEKLTAGGRGRKRGRPPKWLKQSVVSNRTRVPTQSCKELSD